MTAPPKPTIVRTKPLTNEDGSPYTLDLADEYWPDGHRPRHVEISTITKRTH